MTCSVLGCDLPTFARGWCQGHWGRWRRHGDPTAGRTPNGEQAEWLHKHSETQSASCLCWPYSRNDAGYAVIYSDGRNCSASNIMCRMAHGEPPTPEHEAAHSCGKGHQGCINPNHLRWATKAENEADKREHGTLNCGERNGAAKLTAEQVIVIRRLLDMGVPRSKIAEDFSVTQSNISAIARRKSWAHIAGGDAACPRILKGGA